MNSGKKFEKQISNQIKTAHVNWNVFSTGYKKVIASLLDNPVPQNIIRSDKSVKKRDETSKSENIVRLHWNSLI